MIDEARRSGHSSILFDLTSKEDSVEEEFEEKRVEPKYNEYAEEIDVMLIKNIVDSEEKCGREDGGIYEPVMHHLIITLPAHDYLTVEPKCLLFSNR